MPVSCENIVDSFKAAFSGLLNMRTEQLEAYGKAVAPLLRHVTPYELNETCKAMVGHIALGRIPAPKQLLAMHRKLAVEREWIRKPESRCGDCGGLAFVFTRFRVLATGDEYDAVKPCPSCGQRRPTKEGVVEVDRNTPHLTRWWKDLPEASRQHVIQYGESLAQITRKPDYLERFINNVTAPTHDEPNE